MRTDEVKMAKKNTKKKSKKNMNILEPKRCINCVDFLMMTKRKFALSANFLIVFLLLHNIITAYNGNDVIFFTLFIMTLVYFISMSMYSLYIDVIKK